MLRWQWILLAAFAPAIVLAGPRVLFDAADTTPADWETGQGMSVRTDSGLELKLKGEAYSWAASKSKIAAEPAAQVQLQQDPAGTPAKVQIEWFSNRGEFIGASDCSTDAAATAIEPLMKAMPAPPAQMRFKLWLEGEGKQATFRKLRVEAPLQWREGPVTSVQTLDATTKLTPDAGFVPGKLGTAILGTLTPETQYSAVVFDQRLAYSPKAIVMLDVARVTGDFGLQLLCWDKDGNFINALSLLKNVSTSGTIEMPISIYADQIPPGTQKVSFKLWLGGGKTANLQLRAIHYGLKAGGK